MSDSVETHVFSVPLGPIGERDRILALDVLRGVALLGIFFVNMPFFGGTFASLFGPIGGEDAPTAEFAAWAFIKIFCEYKFISLFSLLFGMGLVVMMTRAKAAGRPYVGVYLRRLLILAGFGLGHVIFLWYGDILFFYAGCGVILLILSVFSGRALLITALSIFVLAGVVVTGLGALQVGTTMATEGTREVVVADGGADTDADADTDASFDAEAFRRAPMEALVKLMMSNPMFLFEERFSEIERIAYGEGPFRVAASLRLFTWGFILIQMIFSLAWRIVAVFTAGAGLMKLDFFAPHRRAWHRGLCIVGLGVGLPLEGFAFWLTAGADFGASWRWLAGEFIHYFGSMTLCFGYVGAVVLLVQGGVLPLVARGFAAVGRMALTNYILQSVVAAWIMYWWGLAKFDTLGRPQMLALVVAIFLGQIVFSLLWFRVFRMGPLEFVWRTLTYLRMPRLLRGGEEMAR